MVRSWPKYGVTGPALQEAVADPAGCRRQALDDGRLSTMSTLPEWSQYGRFANRGLTPGERLFLVGQKSCLTEYMC